MAFNPAPSAIWPGCTYEGHQFSIPLSVLGITDIEAMDWRKLLQALLVHARAYVASLPLADRPRNLRFYAPVATEQMVTDGVGEALLSYDAVFKLQSTIEVV